VFEGALVRVGSQGVSREVLRWDVLLCRVMPGDPAPSLWGPVLVFAPDEEPELLAEVGGLAKAHRLRSDPPGLAEACRVASRQLLRFVPPSRLVEPSLFTTEGDPLACAHARWRLADPEAAFALLDDPPELLWMGESEDGGGECFQLTADRAALVARRSPLPPRALCFESSYEGFPDRIGVGTFVLAGCALRFDAISEARLERALALVAARLGGGAVLVEREVGPLGLERPRRQPGPAAPELEAVGTTFVEAHIRRWLDEPLERLNGMSPRAAASVPALRAELELLLRSIENRAERNRRAGQAWPDVGWLRQELGVSPQLAA
jgi:hypothetical protein